MPSRAPTLDFTLRTTLPDWNWPFRVRFALNGLPEAVTVLPEHAPAIIEAHEPDALDLPAMIIWSVGPGSAAWLHAARRELLGRITAQGRVFEILNDR
jgi:hypothetical protein